MQIWITKQASLGHLKMHHEKGTEGKVVFKKYSLPILMFLSCCLLLLHPPSAYADETVNYTTDVGLSFSEKMPPKPPKTTNDKPKGHSSETNKANKASGNETGGKRQSSQQMLPKDLPQTGDQSMLKWVLVGFLITGIWGTIWLNKRMRKPFLFLSGCLLLLISFLGFEKNAAAAVTKSKADLFYLPPDEVITLPKHPYDPNEEIDFADENKATEIKGPLSLDFVPNIQFNAQRGSWDEETYFAPLIQIRHSGEKEFEKVPNFVQVTDDRGTLSGWTLVLRQNGQFQNGTHELKGTEIKLSKLQMVSGESRHAPTAFQEIALDPEGKESSILIQAKKGTGAGTWLGLFGKDNQEAETAISVTVPGEATKEQGKYKTTLTWELHDSPI